MNNRKQVYPPCYNLTHFHGLNSIVMNQEYANLLADSLTKGCNPLTPLLDSLVVDLRGVGDHYVEPSKEYSLASFHDKVTLLIDKNVGFVLIDTIRNSSDGEIPSALWALVCDLRKNCYSKAA